MLRKALYKYKHIKVSPYFNCVKNDTLLNEYVGRGYQINSIINITESHGTSKDIIYVMEKKISLFPKCSELSLQPLQQPVKNIPPRKKSRMSFPILN